MIVLHFVQPELDPLRRFVSEYAVGRMGWLLNAGFFFFAFGLAAFGHGVWMAARSVRPHSRGGILLGASALGILASGLVALFLAMMFIFGPLDLIGLGQRVFLCGVFAWLLLAAHGLRREAFEAPGLRKT